MERFQVRSLRILSLTAEEALKKKTSKNKCANTLLKIQSNLQHQNFHLMSDNVSEVNLLQESISLQKLIHNIIPIYSFKSFLYT